MGPWVLVGGGASPATFGIHLENTSTGQYPRKLSLWAQRAKSASMVVVVPIIIQAGSIIKRLN